MVNGFRVGLKPNLQQRGLTSYSSLVFTVQGMYKLQEPTVVLTCREEDISIVEKQIEPAKKLYADTYQTPSPTITLNKKNYLAAGPKPGSDVVSW